MSSIVVPGTAAPSNLHLSPDVQACVVESDMYDICERIKEISPRLYIIDLRDDKHNHKYAVMEDCKDGQQRLVARYAELDARILENLRYMAKVPLAERVRILEKENEDFERASREANFEELYERLGGPMYNQLEHDGFVQRPKSYPKVGVAKPGKAR